jgi:hypothetical protein
MRGTQANIILNREKVKTLPLNPGKLSIITILMQNGT